MKRVSQKISMAILFCLCAYLMMIASASAHRVHVFAWVEGDTVYVESKFSGGKKVKAGKIIVMDPQGVELLSGLTDDEGEFSFTVPQRTDLKIVLIAGQGHQAEWILSASEMADLPSETASNSSVENATPSGQAESGSKAGMATKSPAPDPAVKRKELEAIIESVLDKKLQPIIRMLTDIRQEGPTGRDIFAGIGYILGLVGIAAYVQSRKKKG